MKTSPNPGGRPKHSGEWGNAIRKVLHEVVEMDDGQRKMKLYRAAEKLVEAAMSGDVSALKEIGDRIDGKPVQAVAGTGENGEIGFRFILDLRE